MIVHNVTTIITELIRVEDGSVIERKSGQQTISQLTEAEFIAAYNQIVQFRDDWEAECQQRSE